MSSESEEAHLPLFSSGTFHALQEKVSHHLIVSWSISITGAEQASQCTSLPIGVFENGLQPQGSFWGLRKRKLMYARYIPVSDRLSLREPCILRRAEPDVFGWCRA